MGILARRNGSHSLAGQRPQPPDALPLKLSHPRSQACRWLRSDGTGQCWICTMVAAPTGVSAAREFKALAKVQTSRLRITNLQVQALKSAILQDRDRSQGLELRVRWL